MANLSNINGKFVVEQTTGYVGIGDTDPDYLLHLASADAVNGTRLAIENTNGSGKVYGLIADNTGVFTLRDVTATTDRLTISNGGDATFTGSAQFGQFITMSSTQATYGYLNLGAASVYGWQIGKAPSSGGIAGNESFYLYNFSNSTVALEVDTSNNATFAGDVEVGGAASITPNANFSNLVITDAAHSGISILSGNTSDGAIYFGDTDSNNRGQFKYLHGSNSMTFSTNDILALTLDSSQNATFAGDVNITQTTDVGVLNVANLDSGAAVGLSLTYPTTNVAAGDGLAIAIGIAGRGRSYIANSNVTTNLDASNLVFYTEDGGVIGERMIIDSSGNVGIGTASPGTYGPATGIVKLDVLSGDIIRSGFTNPANSWIGFTSLPGYPANSYPSVTSKSSLHFANNDKYCAYLEGADTYFGILNSSSVTTISLNTNGNTYFNGGNVGIGTTSPDLTGFGWNTLTVVGGTTAGSAGVLELGSPTTNANGQNLGIIAFMDGSTRNAQINATRDTSSSTSNMHFYTNAGSGIVERMRISSSGSIYPVNAIQGTYYGQDAGNPASVTGVGNTSIGYATGQALTSGYQNVSVGRSAGQSLTTGLNNVSVGTNAGYNNVDGQQNTYIGTAAGYASPGQNYNTFIGYEAGHLNTANENTAVGRLALTANTTGASNTAMGAQALTANQTGSYNTAIGYQSLFNSTADSNTAFGYHAGLSSTTGGSNTFIGQQCHGLNQTGYGNTSVGMQCGYNGTGGIHNTYMGYAAGYGQTGTGGSYNTAIGFYASKTIGAGNNYNTSLGYYAGGGGGVGVFSGNLNTCIGAYAGTVLTTGIYNTLIGYNANGNSTTQSYNVAVGTDAMTSFSGEQSVAVGNYCLRLTTTSNHTAVGYAALYGGTLGAGNTAVGYRCGQLRTGGAHNVFMGGYAAYAAGTGDYNVAIGVNAAYSMTSGTTNTIIGREAGFYLTSAWDCIAIGKNALQGNGAGMTGANNTAIGIEALALVSSSVGNIAIGHSAGFNVSTGSGYNIFLGDTAGYNTSTGSNNILIGWNAGRTGSQTPQSMGGVSTGSNQIQIGNESHTNALVQVVWTINSDARDKTEIKELDLGLEFVNKLKPVTYKWDKRSKYEDLTPDGTHTEEKLQIGFVAQDIIELEKEYGHTIENKTNLATWESEDKWKVGIQHANLIPSLVKAIQELKAEIEILKSK